MVIHLTSTSALKAILRIFFLILSIGVTYGCDNNPSIEWISPYKDIDWDNVTRAKAQFHTHTTRSDGLYSPQVVVDMYTKHGYDILAITDHWMTTWPWKEFSSFNVSDRTQRRLEAGENFDGLPHEKVFVYEDRDPDTMSILPVKGAEPSHTGRRKHHMVSLFSSVNGQGMGFEETISAAGEAGGLLSFAHPGRGAERNNNELRDYIYYLDKYPHIYGIDIFTRATFTNPERWPYTLELIAGILNNYGSPDNDNWRPVWFTATDDLHRPVHIDRSFQVQLIDDLTETDVYNSLLEGSFFWVAKATNQKTPVISSIDFDNGQISVAGTGFDKVSWYFNNSIIHTGKVFDLPEQTNNEIYYVFFIAETSDFSIEKGTGAMIGSQPFWVMKK